MDWYTYWADRLKPEYELREVPRTWPRAWMQDAGGARAPSVWKGGGGFGSGTGAQSSPNCATLRERAAELPTRTERTLRRSARRRRDARRVRSSRYGDSDTVPCGPKRADRAPYLIRKR